jgi:hypothetical protein
MAEMTSKKTGTTPLVDVEDLAGGRVHGVTPVDIVLVKFRNGRDGKDEVRLAAVIPGGEVYFFPTRTFEQAQNWIKGAIIKKIEAQKSSSTEGSGPRTIEITEDNTTQV